ncbi:MAG: shikimate kinase [Pseudomonadota bacterium]
MAASRLFLIGLMAVGKTTVGRLLAGSLGWQFVDTDQLIEERAGADISWIFDVEGEAGFRAREAAVIDEATHWDATVLATGGGAVLDPRNRCALGGRGTVVFLDSPIERLVERTSRDSRRPLLQGGNVRDKLQALQQERGPLYREIAYYCFVTDRSSPRVLARRIEQRLREDEVLS